MIKLVYVYEGEQLDITNITGSYSRSDNIDSLGAELNFTMCVNPLDVNFANYEIEIGSKVVLFNNDVAVFKGIVVSASRSSVNTIVYKCFDYGFYLNKSEARIQFNNVTVTTALQRLCTENEIPVGAIADIATKVTKIYNGDKISDIIKDLLKLATNETGKKYRLELRDNLLYIEDYEQLIVTATYTPATGTGGFDVTKIIGSFSSNYSIEDIATRVLIVSSSEKHTQIYGQVEDSNNITKYGLVTKVEKVDDKNKGQAVQIAKNKLQDLNKVKKTFHVTLFGNDNVRSGRTLVFDQPDIGLTGAFLVKNCTHNYNGMKHFMSLELGV